MNIDRNFPILASASDFKGIPSVRILFNVSNSSGSLDLNAAFAKYDNYLKTFLDNGMKIILIINHQTFGEGHYDWGVLNNDATNAKWNDYINKFVNFIIPVFEHYKGKKLTYELWNEGDANSVASVYIPPNVYGTFFRSTDNALKNIDNGGKLINGGFVTGAGDVANYFNLTGLKNYTNIINVHPYGQGGNYQLYKPNGHLADYLNILHGKFPNHQIYITEFGVLKPVNLVREPIEQIIEYAIAFKEVCDDRASYVKNINWFAAYDGQHDCHGAYSSNGELKKDKFNRNLLDVFRTGNIVVPDTTRYMRLKRNLNLRSTPEIADNKLFTIPFNSPIIPSENVVDDGISYKWREVQILYQGIWRTGWIAIVDENVNVSL